MASLPRYAALVFLALALLCYFLAWPRGAVLLFALGVLFEGAFWMTLFARRGKARGQEAK